MFGGMGHGFDLKNLIENVEKFEVRRSRDDPEFERKRGGCSRYRFDFFIRNFSLSTVKKATEQTKKNNEFTSCHLCLQVAIKMTLKNDTASGNGCHLNETSPLSLIRCHLNDNKFCAIFLH